MSELYDVLAVHLTTNAVRILATGKTEANAEAYIKLAVMRRGVAMEFFVEVPENSYREGTQWQGQPGDLQS